MQGWCWLPTGTAGPLFTAPVLVPGGPGHLCAGEQAVLQQELTITSPLPFTFVPTEFVNILDKKYQLWGLEAFTECIGELGVPCEGVSLCTHLQGYGASSVMAEEDSGETAGRADEGEHQIGVAKVTHGNKRAILVRRRLPTCWGCSLVTVVGP